MGYEGHVVGLPDRDERVQKVGESMELLVRAAELVAADEGIISAGGTGTYDINTWATEIQAGSYVLMDTYFGAMTPTFRQALFLECDVISVSARGWAVLNGGLKALGMDHGPPTLAGDAGEVLVVSDEHITFVPSSPVAVGDRVRVVPAHVDPTVAYHDHLVVRRGDTQVDEWPVDLRGW
jgi:D-serine deaminase-like pyridoxal phosphate-dependent protein